jgi:hypothetical protein
MDWCCKLGAGRWGDCGHHRLISVGTLVLDSYIDFILFSQSGKGRVLSMLSAVSKPF